MQNRHLKSLFDQILIPQEISLNDTEIFQRIMLRLADPNADFHEAAFVSSKNDECVIAFLGLSKGANKQFLNFLHKLGISVNYKSDHFDHSSEDVYEIKASDIERKLLPLFQAEFERICKECPDQLTLCKINSLRNDDIRINKFKTLSPEVMQGLTKLENQTSSEYIKGALHTIRSGVKRVIKKENNGIETKPSAIDHLLEPQGEIGKYAREINFAYKQYEKLMRNQTELASTPDAVKLKQDFSSYRDFEKNVNQSLTPSLAEVSSMFGSMNGLEANKLDLDNPPKDITIHNRMVK